AVGLAGWDVVFTGTYSGIIARCYDDTTNRSTSTFTFGSGLVGQVFGWVLRIDATDGLSFWINRAKHGSSVAITTGYTPATGPTALGSSNLGANSADNGYRSFGMRGGNFSPTQANIEAWF